MSGHQQPETTSQTAWASLNVYESPEGYILQERRGSRLSQRIVEASVGLVAAVFIVAAYLRFLLPQAMFAEENISSPLVFSATAVAIGLALYGYGTRGHLPEFGLDKRKGEIWICKLNSQGQARVKNCFAKSDVKSLYVSRPELRSQDAALFIRLKDRAMPIRLVGGQLDEIEDVHRSLCALLRDEDEPACLRAMRRRRGIAAADGGIDEDLDLAHDVLSWFEGWA